MKTTTDFVRPWLCFNPGKAGVLILHAPVEPPPLSLEFSKILSFLVHTIFVDLVKIVGVSGVFGVLGESFTGISSFELKWLTST